MRVLSALIASVVLLSQGAFAQDTTPEAIRGFELYSNGDPSDDIEARRLLEIAAAADQPEAVNALSNMVGNGLGGPADPQRAVELIHRAAELGSIGANVTLANYYAFGVNGWPREPERGLRYAITAAESTSGHPRAVAWAQWRLARMYLTGVGTSVDFVRAYEWTSRAADNGSVQGMNMRASMLALGQGIPENDAESRRWYEAAAESRQPGNAEALRSLGGMLLTGEGGAVEASRGYAYLLMAQQAGDERAALGLRLFADRVTDAARAEAPAISEAWRREYGDPQVARADSN
jgi:uncharacterized protein